MTSSQQQEGAKKRGKKIPLEQDVLTATRQRIAYLYDHFDALYVSFSGGKDSGVLLHLTIEEARRRNRLPVDVLIVDFEAQYQHTEAFIKRMIASGDINPYWICLPLSLRNALSQFQPQWICWDRQQQANWIRPMPLSKGVINQYDYFDFFHPEMEFEEFVYQFARWYQREQATQVAVLIGLRADESLNRFNTIKNRRKEKFNQQAWTTKMQTDVFMAYPIYDWKTADIWLANTQFQWDYNHIYPLMFQAGVPASQQRLCQPFGDEQRKGLWLYPILEPDTWQKLVSRVEGCHFGAKYTKQQGHILGHYRFKLPDNFTYRQYSKFLLNTMPPTLATHYRQRIYKFLQWWRKNGPRQGIHHIPDVAESKLESKRQVPSWRRICKVLIKNDYWCRGLSFGYNKRLSPPLKRQSELEQSQPRDLYGK